MLRVSGNRTLLLERKRIEEGRNDLIKALKSDDPQAAKKALTGMSGNDLSLTSKEFNELAKSIQGNNLDGARKLLGVGKTTSQTTATHNPVTGQPWTNGPVKPSTKKVTLTSQEQKEFNKYLSMHGWDHESPEDHLSHLTSAEEFLDCINDPEEQDFDKNLLRSIYNKFAPITF